MLGAPTMFRAAVMSASRGSGPCMHPFQSVRVPMLHLTCRLMVGSRSNVRMLQPQAPCARSYSTMPQPQPSPDKNISHASRLGDQRQEESKHEKKAPRKSIFQRFRTIMKEYGWWALGVYTFISGIDLSLTFAAIHFFGGEHVEEIEALLFKYIGPIVKKLKKEDDQPKENAVVTYIKSWFSSEENAYEMEHLIARLSGEFVLAFTIHKTLMLPFRSGLTVLATPSFVRWLIKKGWARPLKSSSMNL